MEDSPGPGNTVCLRVCEVQACPGPEPRVAARLMPRLAMPWIFLASKEPKEPSDRIDRIEVLILSLLGLTGLASRAPAPSPAPSLSFAH